MYKVDYEQYDKDNHVYEPKIAWVENEADIYQFNNEILRVTPMDVHWFKALTEEEIQVILDAGAVAKKQQVLQQQILSKKSDLKKLQKELDELEQ